ncbi:Protein of unknown function [Mucilaginibacter pineti]|uniref:DUF3052 domain-containing protein n=1 Tax=Mucilaginibacter pineti TaxID=1391627 RepID=A0A1G6T873_9SPHI|nr:DUF3052 family protein [Mucilaginibacter pineti]SDD24535.1 Protein of unknown function [Mucilaginibacter pineti]
MAGYSGTPLAKKLGIKSGTKVTLINAPQHYLQLFTDMPADVYFVNDTAILKDVIHFFTKERAGFLTVLPGLMLQIKQDGMIWVSWPKKASKVVTDITEDVIRDFSLEIGLVDIKVCAVDETWSGLKLVIPVKLRKTSV